MEDLDKFANLVWTTLLDSIHVLFEAVEQGVLMLTSVDPRLLFHSALLAIIYVAALLAFYSLS